MPRSNNAPNNTSARPRSRGPARAASASQRSTPVDAAADMSTSSAATSATAPNPSYDEIAEAAYHRYLQRGGSDGQDFDDWLEAERELKSRRSN